MLLPLLTLEQGLPPWEDVDLSSWVMDDFARPFGSIEQDSELNISDKFDTAMQAFQQAVLPPSEVSGFLQAQTEAWLSLPFIPRQYDIELLELLIGVAQPHLSTLFQCFKRVSPDQHRLPIEIIALASFGALFTGCTGDIEVGRLLFNDANRMANAYIGASPAMSTMSAADLASLVRSMLVLELFGLCSGFDRAYELAAAYHPALHQVAKEHYQAIQHDCNHPSDIAECTCMVLAKDLQVLNAYRVALFQLHPTLDRVTMRVNRAAITKLESRSHEQASTTLSKDFSYCVSSIISLSHFARIYSSSGTARSSASHRWNPLTIEYYMHRVMEDPPIGMHRSPAWEILSYTALWVVRTPIELIHEVAIDAAKDHKPIDRMTAVTLAHWHCSDHVLIVGAHVEHVLGLAENTWSSNKHYVEAPHEVMCLYLAGLVLWSGRFAKDPAYQPASTDGTKTRLARVIDVVSLYRVSVARSLSRILRILRNLGENEKNAC